MTTNIVFLSNLPCFWDSMRTVYESFCRDKTFNVHIIAENCHFFTEKDIHAIYNQNGCFDLNRLNPTIVFREIPYCEQCPDNFKVNSLIRLRSVPKICYVPYSGSFYPPYPISKFFFGHPFLNYCWKIFVSTEAHKAAFLNFQPEKMGNDKFIVSGSPKLDYYLENKNVTDPTWRLCKNEHSNIKRIIWSVHSSLSHVRYDDNTKANNYSKGFSTFLKYKDYMLCLAKNYPEIDFCLRPHPSLFNNLKLFNHMKQEDIDNYIKLFCSLKNTSVFPTLERDYFDLFSSSCALISDFSSTLGEYLPTKKPILFLQREDAPEFNDWYKNSDHHYKGNSEKDIKHFVDTVVIGGQDLLYKNRIDVLNKYLYTPKNGSGNFIKEHISEQLDAERKLFSLGGIKLNPKYEDFQILSFKKILKALNIKSIIDINCDDDSIFYSDLMISDFNYNGIDIDTKKIQEKRNWFLPYKNIKFEIVDIINNQLPKADLIFCRNILHILPQDIRKLLSNICNSKSKYLIIEQSEMDNNVFLKSFFLPNFLWGNKYSSNTIMTCWEISNLKYYIPCLAICDTNFIENVKIIITKILILLELSNSFFKNNNKLFSKILKSYFGDICSHNILLTSNEVKNNATPKAYSVFVLFFYLSYNDDLNDIILDMLPEAKFLDFEMVKLIFKDVLKQYIETNA